MTNKEQYRQLIDNSITVPIFLQPFWMDIVCENWDVALYSEGGKVLACMPYCYNSGKNRVEIVQPPLTQFLGPVLNFQYEKKERQYAKENQVLAALLSQLPDFGKFHQNWHHSIDNWLPFYWQGFQQTSRYTYLIARDCREDEVWTSLKTTVRNDIRWADIHSHIEESEDTALLYDLVKQNFAYKKQNLPYKFDTYDQLVKCLVSTGRCKIYYASANENAQPVAGGLFIIDANTTYYLIGAVNRSFKVRGALEKLLWLAIKESLMAKRDFDFEGSMLENVEPLFRSFGGARKIYFSISKHKKTKRDLIVEIMRNTKQILHPRKK